MEVKEIKSLLDKMNGDYSFYCRAKDTDMITVSNRQEKHRFLTASLIKVPILLAWMALERKGEVDSNEQCDFGDEPVVRGAGFSWMFRTKTLTYADALLLMIAVSDNFCTNLIISKIGFDRMNAIFSQELCFNDTYLGRKMMQRPNRLLKKDNWTTSADMIRCFHLINQLDENQRNFVSERLLACDSEKLFMRNLENDSVSFYHKSGGLPNVINEWGYTDSCSIFLLTNNASYSETYQIFGRLGKEFLASGVQA